MTQVKERLGETTLLLHGERAASHSTHGSKRSGWVQRFQVLPLTVKVTEFESGLRSPEWSLHILLHYDNTIILNMTRNAK